MDHLIVDTKAPDSATNPESSFCSHKGISSAPRTSPTSVAGLLDEEAGIHWSRDPEEEQIKIDAYRPEKSLSSISEQCPPTKISDCASRKDGAARRPSAAIYSSIQVSQQLAGFGDDALDDIAKMTAMFSCYVPGRCTIL